MARPDVRGILHFQVIILGEEEGEDNDQPVPLPHSYIPDRKHCLPTHPPKRHKLQQSCTSFVFNFMFETLIKIYILSIIFLS
jgi:hypothetical protein